jgi:hypothetical protein
LSVVAANSFRATADQRPIEVYMVAGMLEHGQAEAQASVFDASRSRLSFSLPVDKLFAQVLEAAPL